MELLYLLVFKLHFCFSNIYHTIFIGSPYTKAISAGILRLQEKGILQTLKIKWWKEMHGGGQCLVCLSQIFLKIPIAFQITFEHLLIFNST